MTLDLNVPEADLRAIEDAIASAQSPVGIDAKKTHVIIIHKLLTIERRLAAIEAALHARG